MKKGDAIRFLHQEGGGVVQDVLPDGRLVVLDEYGFDYVVAASDVVLDGGAASYAGHLRASTKNKPITVTKSAVKTHRLKPIEVDLHIEKLSAHARTLSPQDCLPIQLAKVREVMQAHRRQKGCKIVFIHGVGDGTLKTALRRLIYEEFPYTETMDASMRLYGTGATLVEIH